ncbi:Pyruvate/ketoisovalerate oxidoreductases common subunit gamma [uncultured archaeon]|nr:Pyruvate/ketoisovalerate oxidoreductases common subunit gamma [uncultured archaeon]
MVTGAELIALAAGFEGKHSQAFPFFGSEKRGPPVEAYCRIDEKPIEIHEEISEPDIVIVSDPSILGAVDVCRGMKENGIVIVNSPKKPEELGLRAKYVFTVDATTVALKHFKKMILNTVMLGAFCKVTGIVGIDSMKRAINESFTGKMSDAVTQANILAVQEVYGLVPAPGSGGAGSNGMTAVKMPVQTGKKAGQKKGASE